MYSKCIMIGNLTRDPEVKQIGSGEVCKFGIAINSRTSKGEEVCFVDVSTWGKQAEFVAKYFRKGRPILVEGRLKFEEWEKDGKKFSKHSIVADKVAFIDAPPKENYDDQPMLNESKRIFPSDIKAKQAEQYSLKSGQKEIGNNNLDADELPF